MRNLPRRLCSRVRKCTSMMNAGGQKNILSRGGLVDGRGIGIIGDDGFQIGSLSALLSTIAIGRRSRDTGHLFSFVEDGFCDVNSRYCDENKRNNTEKRGGREEKS